MKNQVKLDKWTNKLDPLETVFELPAWMSYIPKVIDGVTFMPVVKDLMRPKLQWVRKDAFQKSGKVTWEF